MHLIERVTFHDEEEIDDMYYIWCQKVASVFSTVSVCMVFLYQMILGGEWLQQVKQYKHTVFGTIYSP